jgi:CRP-like cAMP-binding protein
MTATVRRRDTGSEDLFGACRPKELAAIRRLCTEVAVAPGRVLLREGAPGRQFIVVTAGRARVEAGDVVLGDVAAGSFVGEMALLDQCPCVATVTASTPMHLLVFGVHEFQALMALRIPSVTERMLGTVRGRLRSVDRRLADRRVAA